MLQGPINVILTQQLEEKSKYALYQTQLKESTPEHQQSLKRLLNKKFKEVEDLHEELRSS